MKIIPVWYQYKEKACGRYIDSKYITLGSWYVIRHVCNQWQAVSSDSHFLCVTYMAETLISSTGRHPLKVLTFHFEKYKYRNIIGISEVYNTSNYCQFVNWWSCMSNGPHLTTSAGNLHGCQKNVHGTSGWTAQIKQAIW